MTHHILEEDESEFCKIKIEEFVTSSCLPSDIFIRLGHNKVLLIAREQSVIDLNRIEAYRKKSVQYFLIRKSDFHKYSGLNMKVVKASAESRIPKEKKLSLFKHAGDVLVQQVFLTGMNEELVKDADMVVKNTLSMISESDDLLELLLCLQNSSDKIFSHSLATAVYCCLIAKNRGWVSTPNQYKLAMAAMFHDIGLKEIPSEVFEKPRFLMTANEVRLFESHPSRSRDSLAQIKGFPADLLQIVYQQHENDLGTGFPSNLNSLRVHPLAKVLRVADDFAYALMDKNCKTLAEAQEVLVEMSKIKGNEFEFQSLNALFQALGLPPMTRHQAS